MSNTSDLRLGDEVRELDIARTIVKSLGGDIIIDSENEMTIEIFLNYFVMNHATDNVNLN